MNFSAIQAGLSDEERLLIRRCAELRSRAESGSAAFSQFLSPRERFILTSYGLGGKLSRSSLASLDAICFFWGGYPDAERTVFCALPPYLAYSLPESDNPDDPDSVRPDELAALCEGELAEVFRTLRIKASGYVALTHRDYLGSLVGLGIERSVLGDILTDGGGAYIFVSSPVADFVKTELSTVGRDKVKVTDASLPDGFTFGNGFESISGTVASARLDSVVSELARTSRETAKELIRRGLVEHNYFTAADCDADVGNSDVISIRRDGKIRFGKYIVDSLDGRTGKGRVRLLARKYS